MSRIMSERTTCPTSWCAIDHTDPGPPFPCRSEPGDNAVTASLWGSEQTVVVFGLRGDNTVTLQEAAALRDQLDHVLWAYEQ